MAQVKLDIAIVGGGLAGLTAATFLAQDGHKVTVYERQSFRHKSRGTGGIALFNNAKRLFQQRGILDDVLSVADSGSVQHSISYKGDLIAAPKSPEPHSFVHRADLLNVLHKLADQHGVKLVFDTTLKSISDEASGPELQLATGEVVKADIVLAADGINSFVRREIYPDIRPKLTTSVVLLVDVPEEVMLETKGTTGLWQAEPFQHFLGPDRDIVSWSMRKHDPPGYHLQLCEHAYGDEQWYGPDVKDGPYVTTIEDTAGLLERFSDFEPRVQHILQSMKSYTRWKIAEVPPFPSWSSPNGGFVFIGDAAHAVSPFAGQGANMSMEDAACIAELLRSIESKDDLRKALKIYNEIRQPRLAGLREIIAFNVKAFAAKDGDEAQIERDARLRGAKDGNMTSSDGDWRKYGSMERWQWLIGYDAFAEARKAWTRSIGEPRLDHRL